MVVKRGGERRHLPLVGALAARPLPRRLALVPPATGARERGGRGVSEGGERGVIGYVGGRKREGGREG